jgi:hypothetical protein
VQKYNPLTGRIEESITDDHVYIRGPMGDTGPSGLPGNDGKTIIGPRGLKGESGKDGLNGLDGENGERGAQWFHGKGNPKNISALPGDKYLDTETGNVYEYE